MRSGKYMYWTGSFYSSKTIPNKTSPYACIMKPGTNCTCILIHDRSWTCWTRCRFLVLLKNLTLSRGLIGISRLLVSAMHPSLYNWSKKLKKIRLNETTCKIIEIVSQRNCKIQIKTILHLTKWDLVWYA